MLGLPRGATWWRYLIALAGAYVAVSLAFGSRYGSIVGLVLSVRPETALPVPLAILFGPVAAYAVAGGVLLSALITRSFGAGTVFLAVAMFYLSASADRLWNALEEPTARRFGRGSPASTLLRFVSTVLVSVAGAAAIVAWGTEIAAVAPFYLVAFVETAGLLFATLAFGGPLLLLGWVVAEVAGRDLADRSSPPRVDLRLAVCATAGWLLFGSIGSLGYRSAEKIPDAFLWGPRRVVALVTQPAFGPGAVRLQILFGAVLFVALVFAFHRNDRVTGSEP